MKKCKFIITKDKNTANLLNMSGFNLVSQVNGVFTFINKPPKSFNFSEIDSQKVAYTDILSL